MQQDILRSEFKRLTQKQTIEIGTEVLDIYCNFFFRGLKNHIDDTVSSARLGEGKLMIQMIFSKLIHLRKLFEGVGFQASDKTKLGEIIDPTINAVYQEFV